MSRWEQFHTAVLRYDDLGLWLDFSLMPGGLAYISEKTDLAAKALAAMRRLEAGDIVNTTEKRMVGHYWLRAPHLAPNDTIRQQIECPRAAVEDFAARVHSGEIRPQRAERFRVVLLIGIGGSALGPQLVGNALSGPADKMWMTYLDNTDPDGIDRVLRTIPLEETLTVVISKSGGTPETRNGMLETEAAYQKIGLEFARHAIAVTQAGSKLDKAAAQWLRRFPMEDYIGGRTSVMSVVGLVPMTLQGLDIDAILEGAAAMDAHTRGEDAKRNPAMVLALMWHLAGRGKGEKDMVILPYKDSLCLLANYLQQLVMESLGKAKNAAGETVNQGIAVYGNKGSTDQHAYVQQLRDGLANFFATFIEIRQARVGPSMEVEPGATSGDFLEGFLRGTRKALAENGRSSLTLSLARLDARGLGALIALFERAVGFYATMVDVNAYDQPGVEAGKKAAADFLNVLHRTRAALQSSLPQNAVEIASKIIKPGEEVDELAEDVYHALNHLEANDPRVSVRRGPGPAEDRFERKH